MDRSLDSIGSCSLDVDADSSDISDTSGSLNFPTPISVKDITHEFTANIRERCTLRSSLQPQQPQRTAITTTTTAYVNLEPRTGGVRMVLSPPTANDLIVAEEEQEGVDSGSHSAEKKPSYLNLACCVNGYSNLTTYDSKIRQDINKSREVSPIRPSTSSLQYCKRNNSLAAPVLHSMPLTKQPATVLPNSKFNESNNNNSNGHLVNGDHAYCNDGGDKSQVGSTSSFIQQRVERLYGPGALAQVFYSPKKNAFSRSAATREQQYQQMVQKLKQRELQVPPQSTELSRKFKQLSPSKDYGEFRKKLHDNCTQTATARNQTDITTTAHNGDVDLPVFRHLSHEFRAQLPTVSPKRNVPRLSPAREVLVPLSNGASLHATDVVDHQPMKIRQLNYEEFESTTKVPQVYEEFESTTKVPHVYEEHKSTTKISSGVEDIPEINARRTIVEPVPVPAAVATAAAAAAVGAVAEKDGNYFLKILKDEQVRLLALAAVAEKYIDALTNNPDITEDTFGLLRSASGKARLLVSQKMKQFEGLCHNNLNRSPEDAFPTTLDDLQGFWDMVYLQVEQVDSIYADIEQLKSNDWHRIQEPPKADTVNNKTIKTTKSGNLKAKTSGTTAAGGASGNGSKPAASNSVAAMKREAQRKQLLEMKRQRREALAAAASAAAGADGAAGDADGSTATATKIGDTVSIAVENSS